MKNCPYCAEKIQDEAIKCRFCGELLNGNQIKNNKIRNTEVEKLIYSGTVNWSFYIVPVILIFTIWLSPIGIYYIFYNKNKKIKLTNKKFIYSYGILNKVQLNIKLEKIESIGIKKNLLDLIFGSGTLIISGTGGSNEPVIGLDNPEKMKRAIEKQIN